MGVRTVSANTSTTPTFSHDGGTTNKTITKNGGAALAAGDIAGGGHEVLLRYDSPDDGWELMNPSVPSSTNVITTRGDIIRGDASGDSERLPIGSAGTILTSDGTDAIWSNVSAGGVGARVLLGNLTVWCNTISSGDE